MKRLLRWPEAQAVLGVGPPESKDLTSVNQHYTLSTPLGVLHVLLVKLVQEMFFTSRHTGIITNTFAVAGGPKVDHT